MSGREAASSSAHRWRRGTLILTAVLAVTGERSINTSHAPCHETSPR
jgi:hypothetical protein